MGCRGMERLALRRLSGKPMARLDLIFLGVSFESA